MSSPKDLIQRLSDSQIFRDYEAAFNRAVGLPLALTPASGVAGLPHAGQSQENPFCALMAKAHSSCAACMEVQEQLRQSAHDQPATRACSFGLNDTAVPVRMGRELLGFLQTGQAFLAPPTNKGFEIAARKVDELGLDIDYQQLKQAYFATPVIDPARYRAVVSLLEVFASHLSMLGPRVLIQAQHPEPPVIVRAKDFIAKHSDEELSLEEVARAVNTSTFYFCKLFKKATGLSFTEYLGRLRVEKAKELLANPHWRVSEIAYRAGFQSLTHFNRSFRKVVGQSPTLFRQSMLLKGAPVQAPDDPTAPEPSRLISSSGL